MNARKIVIGIVGMPASGKGTVAEYIEQIYGAPKLRFSDALSKILDRLGIEKTRDHQIKLSEVLRETCGEDILSRAIQIGVERSHAQLVIIDGVRREGDLTALKEVATLHLLGVDAEAKIRYERAKQRGEKSGEMQQTFEEFQQLDQRSTEVTAHQLMQTASIIFDNNGTFEDLYKQVDQYLNALGIAKIGHSA